VRQSVADLVSTHELARRIRTHPWPWLAGGAAAGLAAGRFLPRAVLDGARRGVSATVVPQLKAALMGLVSTAFAARDVGTGSAGERDDNGV